MIVHGEKFDKKAQHIMVEMERSRTIHMQKMQKEYRFGWSLRRSLLRLNLLKSVGNGKYAWMAKRPVDAAMVDMVLHEVRKEQKRYHSNRTVKATTRVPVQRELVFEKPPTMKNVVVTDTNGNRMMITVTDIRSIEVHAIQG